MNNIKQKGFTLAEVLITLGIIGIIAALTIPNVIAGYKKKTVETRLAKLYSSINNAIKLSESDNSDCKYWEWGDINNHRDADFIENWWKKYMNNYMPYVIASKKESQASNSASGNGGYKIYFKDGSALRVEAMQGSYARFVLFPEAKLNTKFSQGTLYFYKKSEKAGIDYFMFIIYPTRKCSIVPLATSTNNTHEGLITKCYTDYKGETLSYGGACAQLILENGWKIPDDYPLKF